jgi:aspartokinase-like uncharacterized kinase
VKKGVLIMRIAVKISGNLIWDITTLNKFLDSIIKIQKNDIRIALVPGGSIFADMVRDLQKKLKFDDTTAHWMAIKSMETYGVFITSMNSFIENANSIEEVYDIWLKGFTPLVMPFNIIKKYCDELPKSWSVTSDAITVFIAHLLKADMAILTKLVDGITVDGKVASILKVDEVPLNQDVIDSYTPVLVKKYGIPVAIINAYNIESLYCLLNKASCHLPYTVIVP